MSWSKLPRPNPCLPCMVGNPRRRKSANPSEDRRRLRALDRMIQSQQPEYDDEELRSYARAFSEDGPMPRDATKASRAPRLKAQADLLGGYPLHPAGLKHNEEKRAAALARFRAMPKKNPKLMVLNPASDPLCAAIERKINRRLTAKEKSLLAQAAREFKTFHGRAASARDIMPVEAPPGTPLVVSMIGRLDRTDYTVPIDGSERKGRWTHEAGDHGRKYKTQKPYLAAIPGRKTHNTVIVQPKGAKTYFKPTHGLMG